MSARDLDELLKKTLEDPRIPARTRREIERVFALGALDPDSLSPREALDALYALKKLL